jgi:hypothetical protein
MVHFGKAPAFENQTIQIPTTQNVTNKKAEWLLVYSFTSPEI